MNAGAMSLRRRRDRQAGQRTRPSSRSRGRRDTPTSAAVIAALPRHEQARRACPRVDPAGSGREQVNGQRPKSGCRREDETHRRFEVCPSACRTRARASPGACTSLLTIGRSGKCVPGAGSLPTWTGQARTRRRTRRRPLPYAGARYCHRHRLQFQYLLARLGVVRGGVRSLLPLAHGHQRDLGPPRGCSRR